MMKLNRLLGTLALLACMAAPAAAQHWPDGPVRIVVPFTAGGSTDVVARIIAEKLTEDLGQPFIVENRAGAGGTIGSEFVSRAEPDGNTLLVGTSSTLAIAPYVYTNLPYQPQEDFAPVMLLGRADVIVAINAGLPINSVQDLIDQAKAQPGELSYGSGGIGSISHLLGEYFNALADVDILHVPYPGDAQMVTDLVSGQLDLAFGTAVAFLPHIRSGAVRALAVTNPERSTTLTDLPTIAEAGVPGYEAVQWFGIVAPVGTPEAIVESLSAALQAIVELPDVQERFSGLGFDTGGGTPDDFDEYLQSENVKWQEIVELSGARID